MASTLHNKHVNQLETFPIALNFFVLRNPSENKRVQVSRRGATLYHIRPREWYYVESFYLCLLSTVDGEWVLDIRELSNFVIILEKYFLV